ncbi:acetyl-CoA synthetase-like protein [Corynespora cassiicola Philippines]|uniref:Acetyl-CoA synthetase-like protein n=1 Tax=Corynespora cassiicola Philippines TaxID=1448308 RepID=A0A2T2NWS6_CORCC|nr:acetyl-CoA synthetase-like protein [Corynespora cassiicola Philippines]
MIDLVDVVRFIHAVLWCGGIAVLINPLSTEYEVVNYLEISRPSVLAGDASTWPALLAAASRQDLLVDKSISIDGKDLNVQNIITLNHLFSQQESLPPFDLTGRDAKHYTAVVYFSSGTSGKAKGVELSHYNIVAHMLALRATSPSYWNASVRGVFFAPLCHIYGLMKVALMGAWVGFYTMLQKRFTLESYLDLSVKVSANALRILPTIAVAIVKQSDFDISRLYNVKYIMCTGAVLPPAIIEIFRKYMPKASTIQGYGMTETSVTFMIPESAHHIGSVGKLLACIEGRIVDDEGKDVPEGEEGEMLVKGPTVFRRYMGNPEASREAFDGPWMKTGDVVRVDKDGFWWLKERKKELIKYKGFQVAPAELEGHLNSYQDVSEGAVCALWDENQGTEVPIAYIALTPAAKAMRGQRNEILRNIQEHVNSKVAPYKKLRGVVALDQIPKSGSGKILRRLLPARLARARAVRL